MATESGGFLLPLGSGGANRLPAVRSRIQASVSYETMSLVVFSHLHLLRTDGVHAVECKLIIINCFRLCRVHRRIAKGFEVFEYYANNQWDFDNAGINHLRDQINDEEKTKFKIDAGGKDYSNECLPYGL